MPIHQSDPNRKPDSEFTPGELSLLAEGNRCRLLDGRRTPGVIERVDGRRGLFRWRIGAFEDEGKSWDVPIENVTRYQFEMGSARVTPDKAGELRQLVERFSELLVVEADSAVRAATEIKLRALEEQAHEWLERKSSFFAQHKKLHLRLRQGPVELAEDLRRFLAEKGFLYLEEVTTETLVTNPNSGEWIKGMLIVLAEMGIVGYSGKIVRTPDLFEGIGAKSRRSEYLLHRLAFVRAAFRLAGHNEVVVYRGMSSELDWRNVARSILSCTFSLRVARAFANFDIDDRARTSYLMKLTVPVERLWMTYCETSALNGRYLEAEALLLNEGLEPF
ncbi:hypothetical protein JW848_10775 [Candidatus Bipolaricaulota bacterium]|nr:hypothetical protein [Candidatus Bipolaricaulota bacterium]